MSKSKKDSVRRDEDTPGAGGETREEQAHDERAEQIDLLPPSVEAAAALVGEWYAGADSGHEMTYPLLHMWDAEGTLTVGAIAIEGGGAQYAAAARGLIIVTKPHPVLVALAGEAWAADVRGQGRPQEQADPRLRAWLERRRSGQRAQVMDLPPELRFEILSVLAEDKEGNVAHQSWRIDPPAHEGEPRRYSPLARAAGGDVKTHMLPLMVREDFVRRGRSEAQARAWVQTQLRMSGLVPPSGLS